MYFRHSMIYPDGTQINGKLDHSVHLRWLQLDNVENQRILDIATNDGFFAFWAEWYGKAKHVLAIDVDTYDQYDWGINGPPNNWQELQGILKQPNSVDAFKYHHKNTNSKVEKLNLSIYDLSQDKHGLFDVIFNFGLLYHLRNPIMALEKCYQICKGFMFLETAVFSACPKIPLSVNANSDLGIATATDYFFPTESCTVHWLKHAGFSELYIEKKPEHPKRQRFIAIKDANLCEKFDNLGILQKVDEFYWEEVRKNVKDNILQFCCSGATKL